MAPLLRTGIIVLRMSRSAVVRIPSCAPDSDSVR